MIKLRVREIKDGKPTPVERMFIQAGESLEQPELERKIDKLGTVVMVLVVITYGVHLFLMIGRMGQ
jgi:hypothetical protein